MLWDDEILARSEERERRPTLAALLILPALQTFGFTPGAQNTDAALRALTVAYAVVPCVLKLCALAIILALPRRTGA